MKPYQTTVRDRVIWRVKYPKTRKKGEKVSYTTKQYKSKEAAQVAIDNFLGAKEKAGAEAAHSTLAHKQTLWVALDNELKEYHTDLTTLAEERLEQLRGTKVKETLDNALAEYVIYQREQDASPRYIEDIQQRCGRFRDEFGKDKMVDEVSEDFMANWLSALKLSHTTRDHYRRYLLGFFKFCYSKKYIGKVPVEQNPTNAGLKRSKKRKKKTAFTPAQAKQFLHILTESDDYEMCIYGVISMFSGIRSAEFRKYYTEEGETKEIWLTWGDINLKQGHYRISEELSKTIERDCTIHDTLKAWVEYFQKKHDTPEAYLSNAPVLTCDADKVTYRWRKFRERNDINKIYSNNILRHTFGTFYTAVHGASKAATQAGDSEAIMRKHYAKPANEVDAEEFWSLTPDKVLEDNVVQMGEKAS